MTGRHAGPVHPGETSTLDQVIACQADISRFLVDAATAPLMYDPAQVMAWYASQLKRVYPLLNRVSAVLLQVEAGDG